MKGLIKNRSLYWKYELLNAIFQKFLIYQIQAISTKSYVTNTVFEEFEENLKFRNYWNASKIPGISWVIKYLVYHEWYKLIIIISYFRLKQCMAKEELQEGRGAGRGWSGWWQGRHCIRFGGPATGAAIQMTLTRFLRFLSLLIVKTISYFLMWRKIN